MKSQNNETRISENDVLDLIMDSDFIQVSDASQKFSPFEVLRLKNYEIRHSNMLAWLLDPNETHGMGDTIAQRFVMAAYREYGGELKREVDIAKVYSKGLEDLQVHRELANIDIILVSDVCKLAVIIENKWHAGEGIGQLSRYLSYAEKRYKEYAVLPVFLTLDGADPTDTSYGSFSYGNIISVLQEGLRAKESAMSDEIQKFIGHYIQVLMEKLGMDEREQELDKLCSEIYSKHKKAIDRIYAAGNDQSLLLSDVVKSFCDDSDIKIVPEECCNLPKVFSFVPEELFCEDACVIEGWNRGRHVVTCWFEVFERNDEQKICFAIEVGPLQPAELRLKLLESINEAGLRVGLATAIRNNGGKYSKVGKTDVQGLSDDLATAMKTMYKRRQKDIAVLAKVIKEFDWKSGNENISSR